MVNMNAVPKGMIHWLFKPRGSIREKLTVCLQRDVVFGYESMLKCLISNTNNIMLQIIPTERNYNLHHRTEET
jgi:hypothetical protein